MPSQARHRSVCKLHDADFLGFVQKFILKCFEITGLVHIYYDAYIGTIKSGLNI